MGAVAGETGGGAMRAAMQSMVRNYRDMAIRAGYVCVQRYTDDELLAVIDYWQGMSTSEEQEQAVMDDVKNEVRR